MRNVPGDSSTAPRKPVASSTGKAPTASIAAWMRSVSSPPPCRRGESARVGVRKWIARAGARRARGAVRGSRAGGETNPRLQRLHDGHAAVFPERQRLQVALVANEPSELRDHVSTIVRRVGQLAEGVERDCGGILVPAVHADAVVRIEGARPERARRPGGGAGVRLRHRLLAITRSEARGGVPAGGQELAGGAVAICGVGGAQEEVRSGPCVGAVAEAVYFFWGAAGCARARGVCGGRAGGGARTLRPLQRALSRDARGE